MQCKILDRVAGFLIFVSEIPADASAFFGPAPDRTALMASGAEFRISTWCARAPPILFFVRSRTVIAVVPCCRSASRVGVLASQLGAQLAAALRVQMSRSLDPKLVLFSFSFLDQFREAVEGHLLLRLLFLVAISAPGRKQKKSNANYEIRMLKLKRIECEFRFEFSFQ